MIIWTKKKDLPSARRKKIARHEEKLSVRDGILWLGRTISSEKIMNKILKRLHEEHPGTIIGYCKRDLPLLYMMVRYGQGNRGESGDMSRLSKISGQNYHCIRGT